MARVTQLILEAETYEVTVAVTGDGREHGASAANSSEHPREAWSPADGIERTLFTALANVISGIGFALLLVAIFAFRGALMDFQSGINWGLAGFAAFTLAPALGLPPEHPGNDYGRPVGTPNVVVGYGDSHRSVAARIGVSTAATLGARSQVSC